MSVAELPTLKAPFPAFGGKSRIADAVWGRIGNVRNAIEPFAFSSAWILRRPHTGAVETINDRNAFVANFWRAVQHDPDAVAAHADWPVNETDLHARHRWLVGSGEASAVLQGVRDDPGTFDVKIAGWWCWGACCWIGSGWCDESVPVWLQRPHIGDAGSGIHGDDAPTGNKRVKLTGNGVGCGVHADGGPNPRRPGIAQAGWGINTGDLAKQAPRLSAGGGQGINAGGSLLGQPDDTHRPQLADAFARGRGVNGNDSASACEQRSEWIKGWMRSLSDRLRPVRVCCGHWSRICDSPSTMTRLGTTGVFLDPPYRVSLACGKVNRTAHIYASDKTQDINALCDEVEAWCLRWGQEKDVRIALCGLEGEYPAIEAAGWEVLAWKSNGGYGNQSGKTNDNARRERVWFSPGCLMPGRDGGLFQ